MQTASTQKVKRSAMAQGHSINDCFLHDKERLRHDEAITLLAQRLPPITETQTVALGQAIGRVLAQDIIAPHAVPLHTNAAVDGYAFAHHDLSAKALPISQRIAAGQLAPPALEPGTAARIFTGAVMPSGAETVAMQEDCTVSGETVQLPATLKAGANCRLAAEDLAQGETVLEAGTVLKASHIAAAASVGAGELMAFRPLKVALFSNGNELRNPEATGATPIRPGEVFDTNGPMLKAAMAGLPVELISQAVIGDTLDATRTALAQASQQADVIITSGGASRGEEDHMLTALEALGKRHLWQLAIKPGRPMMMGQIRREASNTPVPSGLQDCLYFGLPGNPVAAFVCFLLYLRPALIKLAGGPFRQEPRFTVTSGFDIISKKPDRREFLRARLVEQPDGTLVAEKFDRDGSGLISSLRTSDGLVEIEEHVTSLSKGDPVRFLPFPFNL
ncbi:MAG: gephyrin-like molybdotransferase Glp [Pseudomonadota bacterium]